MNDPRDDNPFIVPYIRYEVHIDGRTVAVSPRSEPMFAAQRLLGGIVVLVVADRTVVSSGHAE